MKVLELFCGTKSISNAFLERGHEVFTVDWEKGFTPTLCADIGTLTAEQIYELCGGIPDVIWASPDCTTYSVAAISYHRRREPDGNLLAITEYARKCDEINAHVVELIKELKPRYFIYENNKSMSPAIRDSIDKVFGFGAVHIDSALVSAQNRQRLYWVGKRNADGTYSKVDIQPPADRGILLRDILETDAAAADTERKIVGIGWRGRKEADGKYHKRYETTNEEKANALTTVQTDSMVAVPIRMADIDNSIDRRRIFEVHGGYINIKGTDYPIKLSDGLYFIRNLTLREYRRAQTVPDWYMFPVSDAQAYKMLGNGWTVEVIAWLISHIAADIAS